MDTWGLSSDLHMYTHILTSPSKQMCMFFFKNPLLSSFLWAEGCVKANAILCFCLFLCQDFGGVKKTILPFFFFDIVAWQVRYREKPHKAYLWS